MKLGKVLVQDKIGSALRNYIYDEDIGLTMTHKDTGQIVGCFHVGMHDGYIKQILTGYFDVRKFLFVEVDDIPVTSCPFHSDENEILERKEEINADSISR